MKKMLASSYAPLVERAVGLSFGAVDAKLIWYPPADEWRLTFKVPDMVPPLRKWNMTWSGWLIDETGTAAMVRSFVRQEAWFDREREARRWAAVDP